MEESTGLLKGVALFNGIAPADLDRLLGCLQAMVTRYANREVILLQGDTVHRVGIVLLGRVQVVKEDYLGNRNILTEVGPGNMFAETFSCIRTDKLPISVISATDSTVLWVDFYRIVTGCPEACGFHSRLIENMMVILASKNIQLNQKIDHITRRTTREKLLSYLSDQARQYHSREFDIPFNRQELADYLCVERSAMSNELGKLRDDGVLEFKLRHFKLI